MSIRHALILVTLSVALSAYVWFFENPWQTEVSSDANSQLLFPELVPTQITQIKRQTEDGTLTLEKLDGRWQLRDPMDFPADETRIEAFLSEVSQWSYRSRIESPSTGQSGTPKSKDPYGFKSAPEQLTITNGQTEIQLDIGDTTATGNLVFVRRAESGTVQTIDAALLAPLQRPVDTWRDPRLVPFPTAQIQTIGIATPRGEVQLERVPEKNAWRMVHPVQDARLDLAYINAFLEQLAELRIASFEKGPDAPPQMELAFGQANGRTHVIHVQGTKADNASLVWAFLPETGTSITLAKAFVAPMIDPVKTFRSPYLLDQDIQFDQITVKGSETFTLYIDQAARAWRLAPPFDIPADNELVTLFQRQFAELRINEFRADGEVSLTEYGLDFPYRSLVFQKRKPDAEPDAETEEATAEEVLRVDFGFKILNNLMTHRSDEDAVYAVPYGAVMQLPDRAFKLRERRVWSATEADIDHIRITGTERPETDWRRKDGLWHRDGEALSDLDHESVAQLLGEVLAVEALSWVEQPLIDPQRFDLGPRRKLEITLTEGAPLSLQFGSISPRGNRHAFTQVDGKPTVFEFPGDLYVKLHHVFDLEPQTEP